MGGASFSATGGAYASTSYVDTGDDVLAAGSQSGTTYTLVLADAGNIVEMTNASANTVTIPTNATVAFPIGTVTEIFQYGAGQTTIAPAAGVTLRSAAGLKIAAIYGSASVRKRATDEWVVSGYTTT